MALAAGFTATGCYIYYNTNVLNTYRSTERAGNAAPRRRRRSTRSIEYIPQPRIMAVKANVDIHPERRAVFIAART